MKKLIALTLALCMIAVIFAGCSSSNEQQLSSTSPNNDAPDNVVIEPDTEAPVSNVTVAETVLFDQDGVKATLTGVDNTLMGTEFKILVENSTDRNIVLSGSDVIVNGVTMYGWLYIDVAAGKKSNGSIVIGTDDLLTANISEIATVNAPDAHIVDNDTYQTICDTPFAFETSIASGYTQVIDDTGDVIFEQSGTTVIAQTLRDEFYGNTVQLLVKNASGKDIIVQAENISVNSFTVDAWLYDVVYNGSVRFCDLDLFASGLEENGIESIENVSFTIRVLESESFAEIASSEELQVFVNS